MLRLATGEAGALARRRVPLAELERLDDSDRVLAILTGARLLTVGDGEVELSHEALLREWPRYRAWLEEDSVGRRLHAHLTAAAREWDLQGRDPAELYRGARLGSALDWTAHNRDWCNSLEREFIQASRLEANRDAERERSQHRRLRSLGIAAGALLAVAVLAGTFALVKQHSASNAASAAAADARAALSRQLGAEAVNEPRLDLAMLLAREAVNLNRSQQTEGTLLSTLLRSPAVIGSFVLPSSSPGQLALSADAHTLAVSNDAAGELSFYDTDTHVARSAPLTDFTGDETPVYSSDGSVLVYPTEPSGVQRLAVRDARTLALVAELPFDSGFSSHHTGDIPQGSILIAPDGRTVYYAYWVIDAAGHAAGAYLDRWSLPSGRLLSTTRIGSGALLALRLIDAGSRLVVVSRHTVTRFAVNVGRSAAPPLRLMHSVTIAPTPALPSTAAISADGDSITIGSQTGSVSFVSSATGAARPGLGARGASVADVFYAPNDRTVATVGDDNTVTMWDPRTGTSIQELTGPTGQVQSAAVSPDGTMLYTSSLDGDVLTWDLTGNRQFGRHARLGAGARCCSALSPRQPPLAVSPDGSQFAVRLSASAVGLFSTRTLQRLQTVKIRPPGDGITALAWAPTAPLLAVAGHAGFVQIFDVAGRPRLVRSLVGLHALVGRPEAIQSLAFSPNGSLLAASEESETRSTPDLPDLPAAFLAVWRTGTGTLIGAPRDLEVGSGSRGSEDLAFAPGGKLLAANLPDGQVLVLDATTGAVTQTLNPASGSTSLAFAPNGTLATGTVAGTVQLWDPITGGRLAPALIAASAPITSIAFDPSGQRFATTGYQDGTVKLWFTSSLQQEGPALNIDAGATSAAAFEPGGSGLLVLEASGTAFLWPASLSDWEQRACAVAGDNLSRQEWARLVGQPRYAAICAGVR